MTKLLDHWLAPFVVDATSIAVADVRIDSREVKPSDVFVATQGFSQNGVQFIDKAIEAGAVAILVDSTVQVADKSVPVYPISQLTKTLPQLLSRFYDQGVNTQAVGITGTNGKTTVSQLLAQLGEQVGCKTAVVGTLGAGRLGQLEKMNNTTPGIADNYRLLDQFATDGCDFVAMEVSSQGLDQDRVAGIAFDTTVFTNLSQDHLDYHGDLDSYAAAKKMLFEQNPQATRIINIDDATGLAWYQQWQDRANTIELNSIAIGTYDSAFASQPHVMFDDIEFQSAGLAFTVKSSWGETKMKCPLFGRFNLHNLVSAMAVHLVKGVALQTIADAAEKLSAVPGRMERFCSNSAAEVGVVAIVDYAHTPDALKQALQAVKAHVSGRLWCIFGCGGDRDQGKRPLMGKMAELYADEIVVTNDNPRHETPEQIVKQILDGMSCTEQVTVELDRKQAILQTLKTAANGDIVLIAGKGHETSQIFCDEITQYDERDFVRQYFAQNIEELAS